MFALIGYWAALYPKDDEEALAAGVDTMLQISLKPLNKKAKKRSVLLIEEKADDHQYDSYRRTMMLVLPSCLKVYVFALSVMY